MTAGTSRADEPTVRQRRIDGAPVLETRIKVPNGDAVHRVWCVADGGGYTVVEIENDSSLPFAVAFNRSDLLSSRPPASVPIQGIELPADSDRDAGRPQGHGPCRARPRRLGAPGRCRTGCRRRCRWPAVGLASIDAAGRMVLPDDALLDRIAQLRGRAGRSTDPSSPMTTSLASSSMSASSCASASSADPWVPDVAAAVAKAARPIGRSWRRRPALDDAAEHRAGRAARRGRAASCATARRTRSARRPASSGRRRRTAGPPSDRELVWLEQRLARVTSRRLVPTSSPRAFPRPGWVPTSRCTGCPSVPRRPSPMRCAGTATARPCCGRPVGPVVPLTASAVAPRLVDGTKPNGRGAVAGAARSRRPPSAFDTALPERRHLLQLIASLSRV